MRGFVEVTPEEDKVVGNVGVASIAMFKGDKGDKGDIGPQGIQGPVGPRGDVGPQGIQGLQGPVGPKGDIGPRGTRGIQGLQGPVGPKGDTGPRGLKGDKGEKGEKGEKGDKGDAGAAGKPGADGKDGKTPVKGVDYLTDAEKADFLNEALELAKSSGEFNGVDGEKGDKGDTGDQGPAGPQGEKGETGAAGPQGPQGPQGIQGEKGDPGVNGKDGQPGKDGADGKTPVKGVDYWTATDKQEIVDDVLGHIDIPEGSGGSAEVPVFDLASRGVPAVTLPQGASQVAGDMSDIVTALSKGSAIFKIPVSLNGMEISISMTMQAFTDGSGEYQCISMVLHDAMLMAIVSVNIGEIFVAVAPAVTLLGLPFVTGANNGQIMQVVNGTWTSVSVAESTVKTYVDEYLSAALEGDY